MSLIHLLSVGESWVGHRPNTTRYKMREENLLPNFSAKGDGGSVFWRMPKNLIPRSANANTRSASTGTEQKCSQRESLRASRRSVQTELNLDTVRVVRNDLAEDDLEFAPAKSEESPFVNPCEPQTKPAVVGSEIGIAARVTSWLQAVRAMF